MDIEVLKEKLNGTGIEVSEFIEHNKASEEYVRTKFIQDDGFEWNTVVPYVNRRANLRLDNEDDIAEYLVQIKPYFTQQSMADWRAQELNRNLVRGEVTKEFFNVLLSFNEEFERFPQNNNPARRIQDIKDFGYTIASVPGEGRRLHRIMLPIPLASAHHYETFSPQLKARIIRLLGAKNAYEAKIDNANKLIPDHKFSEVRWTEHTAVENPDTMTDEEIINKFQLLDNQRNEQKREVCRKCFQEGVRGTIYGIKYYYEGESVWNEAIPKRGREAEVGCVGCPWYDIELWRRKLNEKIENGD